MNIEKNINEATYADNNPYTNNFDDLEREKIIVRDDPTSLNEDPALNYIGVTNMKVKKKRENLFNLRNFLK